MKARIFVILALAIFPIMVFAQDRKTELDSLIRRANSLPKDTLKAKVLARIHERMMFMDNERAFEYAKQAFELSKSISYEKGVANGLLQFGNYYYNQSKNDSSELFHRRALQKFRDINSIRGQVFALHSLATIEREKGNYDEAISLTTAILAMYTEENKQDTDLGDFDLRGSEYEVLGGIYMEKGNYRLALENSLRALSFFEEVKDEVRAADALKQISDIEFQLENYESSMDYVSRAIKIYRKNEDKVYLSYALNTAGLAAEKMNRSDSAEAYYEESIALAREMNVQSIISQSLNDLARIRSEEGDHTTARAYLNESIEIATKQDIKLDQTEALHALADLNILENDLPSALANINKVISIAEDIKALPALKNAYRTRAEIRKKLGAMDVAYDDLQQFHSLNDTIYNIKKNQQIEELKTIYETEKKEAAIALQLEEIETLNEKAKVDTLTKSLYAGGFFTFVAVSGLLFFGFRQRIKKNRMAREKQEAIYRQEIAHKKKELTSQTLHLVQKNTFIQELMENLENIKNHPEKFKMEFRRIVMLLKKENASDKDWEVFKTYFADVHNDFDQKLKTLYADISEKEIRLAAFLRMNLTTKEIAATLNVLPDSILKSKYRLKKKLDLDKETDLTTFLNRL